LTITAGCGGSNGNRARRWKTELGALADQTGLQIPVCHFPPGTSKWNKIEHRLFGHISINWRAKPLISRQVVIDLIAATTSTMGLKVYARLDETAYPKGIKITDANSPPSSSSADRGRTSGASAAAPELYRPDHAGQPRGRCGDNRWGISRPRRARPGPAGARGRAARRR
jgi:hypothetical protein